MFSQAEKGSMYRACSLLGQSFGARPVAYKNFYIQLTFEKMRAFEVFTNKYLRSCGCSVTNSTPMVYYKSPKTEMKSKIIKTQILEMQI